MSENTENLNRWIEQAGIDYISHYIKAWIPFNAWYNHSYPNQPQERKKLNEIISQPNTFRGAIESLMESADQYGNEFRSYIGALYLSLSQVEIHGRDGKIHFDSMLKKVNIKTQFTKQNQHHSYMIERTDARGFGNVASMLVTVNKKSDNSFIFNFSHNEYNLDDMLNRTDYKLLKPQIRENLRLGYLELTPVLYDTIIESNPSIKSNNFYNCSGVNFKRETTNTNCYSKIVCQSLVELLYQLRNVLFHGNLVPNQATQEVYKNAYHILFMLIQKLR